MPARRVLARSRAQEFERRLRVQTVDGDSLLRKGDHLSSLPPSIPACGSQTTPIVDYDQDLLPGST
jgi:hypothetical protein